VAIVDLALNMVRLGAGPKKGDADWPGKRDRVAPPPAEVLVRC
jgi:hypothetical protein